MHIVSLLGYAPRFGWAWADAIANASAVTVVDCTRSVRSGGPELRHGDGRTWWELPVVALPGASLSTSLTRRANTRRLTDLLRRIEHDGGPIDAVHGNFYSSLAPFGATGFPTVVTEHSSLFLRQRWPEMAQAATFRRAGRMARYVYDRCDRVFAISGDQRRGLEAFGVSPDRLTTIPNPVDPAAFFGPGCTERTEPRSRPAGGTRLMTACRLAPTKNLFALVDAVAELAESNSGLTLDVYGAGPLDAELERVIAARGLQAVVRLAGHVSQADLAAAYGDHDLYVCSSKVESFGLPMIEALLTGLAVAATPVGIALDLAEAHPTSAAITLASGWTAADLAAAIDQRLATDTLGDRAGLRDALIDRFSPAAVGQAVVDVVTGLAADTAACRRPEAPRSLPDHRSNLRPKEQVSR